MAEKKQKYVVVKPNTRDYKVGEKVDLTDSEAAKLVNKVRLADSFSSDAGDAAQAELKTAQDALAERDKELEGLKAELKTAQDALAERDKELEGLKADAQLAKMTGNSGKK